MFITFEGIEGCGKSTQALMLYKRLQGKVGVLLTAEPGGTPIGKAIRDILLNSQNRAMVPLAELFLYEADRAQHVSELIRPALETGLWVLCDRYCDATFAYQGYARGQDLELITFLNHRATGGLKPDLTILLDCPVEVGLERAHKRDKLEAMERSARFENEPEMFHQAVRDGYLKLAKQEPERFVVMDAALDRDTLSEIIYRTVAKHLPGPGVA